MIFTQIDNRLLIAAIITITSALVFYTIGVWGEKLQKKLKLWHIAFFLLGLCADTIGTTLMEHIASLTRLHDPIHTITGFIAIILMSQNLDKENFNVDNLANEVNMSRTSLHRKLKDISGLTPGDFIRLVRLKKAAELLQSGEYRINEICILVGIHSQSYFTKSFHKQFGILPKDFARNNTVASGKT